MKIACFNSGGIQRTIEVKLGKQVRIRLKGDGGVPGEVLFSIDDGMVMVETDPSLSATLDSMPVTACSLEVGEHLMVGDYSFSPLAPDAGDGTEEIAAKLGPCSSCGKEFTGIDIAQGWQDKDYRICAECIEKGVRPQHLPGWRHNLEVDIDPDASTGELLPQRSGEIADDYAEPDTEERIEADSSVGVGRSSRRISASRLANVEGESAQKSRSSILGGLSKVFRRRNNDPEQIRLEELEEERMALLLQAGRESLEEQGGIGLPADLLARLGAGEQVSLTLLDCERPRLDAWRSRVRHLAHLDAEILAIRQRLGLGSDPVLKAQIHLRTEQKEREELAFQASDGLNTEELGQDFAGMEPAEGSSEGETEAYEAQSPAASSSGSSRRRSSSSDQHRSMGVKPASSGVSGRRRRRRR